MGLALFFILSSIRGVPRHRLRGAEHTKNYSCDERACSVPITTLTRIRSRLPVDIRREGAVVARIADLSPGDPEHLLSERRRNDEFSWIANR